MADDLNTEIKIGADASGVEAGVSRAKRSLKDLGESAKKAGQDAGAGIGAIGAGGDKAAKDVERATKNIQGQLQRAIASFDAGEKGSRKFYESLARQRGADVATLKPLLDQLDAYKSKSEAAAQASAKASTSFSGLGAAAAIAGRAVAAIGIATSVGEFIRLADASTNVASRLGLVTSSAAELANVQQRLFGIAQSSRVSFADLVGTYAQVARSTKDLGVSQNALLGVIQTISQAVTISGGSAASAQAALVQLSQGFAAGALRGEELNSIMEQTPRLAQAIADGMGVSVGKLRELGQAGALTAEAVLGALEKSAAGVAAEFGKMAVTVEQASTNAANSVLKLVGAFDKLTGTTSILGKALQGVSGGLDFISRDVEKLGAQGPLRAAAREVINLDAAAQRMRNGMASGVLGPNAQAELDRINARLAEAKQRFRDLDKQLGGATDPRDQTGFTGRGASYANEAKRLAKLQEDANKFRLNLAGVPGDYIKDMNELIRLNQAGIIVGKEYTDALKKQQDELLKKTGVTKGATSAATAEQNAYESLIASVRAKIAEDKLELDGGLALTESQKIRIKLDQDLAAGRVKLSAAREKEIRQDIDALAASEAELAARRALNKANIEAGQTREKYLASLSTGIDKIRADIQAQEDATARMGLSKEAVAELDAAKLEMLATDLELQAIKAMDRNLDQQTYDSLKEQAKLYRDLASAKKAGAARETALEIEKGNEEAAKKAAEEWQRASDDINRSLTDALLRGFESGKGFAQNLRDTIKNMFSTLVLRPIVSAVVNPVAGAITGALGLAGTANAAASGASTLGGIGNLASLGSTLFSSGLGSTISGAIGSGVGALFGTTAGNAALGTSLGLGAGSATAAAAAAAQAGGASAAAAASSASTGATIAGALPYIGAAVAALTLLAGSFKGETRYGGGFEVVNGKAFRTTGDVTNTLPESAIVQSVQGTFDSINKILGQYGSEFVATNIKAGIETSGKGRGGVFAGGLLSGGGATDIKFGKFFEDRIGASLNPEEAVQAFGGELNKAVIAALQAATDLPKYVQRQIESVDVNALGADKAAELLQTIGNLPNVLLQGFGTTRDQLAQQFAQGLALGDATAAGKGVADTLVASIEASLYQDAAGKIFDIVNSGIVAPMLDAIATGASVSEALSQATIDKTIERAKAQASALSELFGNAEFVSALEQIRTTVGAALGQAGDAFGYTPKFQLQAAQQIDTAAQSASTAADEAARAWQQITDGLLTDRTTAEIALLRAQGREEEALARERAKAIEGFDAYQIGLYDGTQAILSQVTALEKQAEATKLAQERAAELASTLAGELPGVIDKFLSPAQRESAQYQRIAGSLNEAGIGVTADALMSASKDQIASVALQLYNLGTTSDETRLAILRAASGLADLKDAANAANIASADTAYAALERAVTKQRGILEETVADVREVFDAVRTASRELFGEVEGAAAMQARAGRKFISDALSSAKLTGYLPDGKDLQEAIGAARAGIGASVYASQADADYERLVLANELRDLQSISGDQLTEAEKQIKALDSILDTSKAQLDALKGIDSSVLSVAEALSGFRTAMGKAGGGTAGAAGTTITNPVNGKSVFNGLQGAQFDAASGTGYLAGSGLPWNVDSVRAEAEALLASGQNAAVIAAIKGQGYTHDQAEKILGIDLPQFRIGTNYVPRDMAAIVHEGEAIVPKAYNPAAGGQSSNSEMVAELRAMRQALEAAQNELSVIREHARRTAMATNGLPDQPIPNYVTNRVTTVVA